jgi:cytochrome subunit of sulfide dehydrogenase
MRYAFAAIDASGGTSPMNRLFRTHFAAAIVATSFAAAAQQPAPAAPPPAPTFAAANLTESGVRAMAATCASCHGTGGKPVAGSSVSALAGRSRDDIVQQMGQFKEGKRPATVMHQIAKGYSDAEIAAVADYFSKQTAR